MSKSTNSNSTTQNNHQILRLFILIGVVIVLIACIWRSENSDTSQFRVSALRDDETNKDYEKEQNSQHSQDSDQNSESTNQLTEPSFSTPVFTLTQGTYKCPRDIEAGEYDIKCVEGSSYIYYEFSKDGDSLINYDHIFFNSEDKTKDTYNNLEICKGDKFQIHNGGKLRFIKQD